VKLGVLVGVSTVGVVVGVSVTVTVAVAVPVGMPVGVLVGVVPAVIVLVGVMPAVIVLVGVPPAIGVSVGVTVTVALAVPAGEPVGVTVTVALAVPAGVPVGPGVVTALETQAPVLHVPGPAHWLTSVHEAFWLAGSHRPVVSLHCAHSPQVIAIGGRHTEGFSGLHTAIMHLLPVSHVFRVPKQTMLWQTGFSSQAPRGSTHDCPSFPAGTQLPLWHIPQPPVPHAVLSATGVP
jgi:hypothetical protein